ncbi:hypothetical protein PFISCL1PPCAC_2404 [Pristionchus fissidentatus]|uniref:IBB domain-containing protein n=1 Tax=Pristionchus fissidentatus TaxID=1538716 RepID=A0AAV5UV04_9BILA|nr:hypothetical protein PFISCL1PPCAC_2404 [Pristionchus fissidentatus]
MLPDADRPSSSQSGSRHQGIYKSRAVREDHNVRRRQVTVEIRKKKRDDMLLERRTRNIDPSSLNVEKELGGEVIRRLMSQTPTEISEGLTMTVEKMQSSVVPLGMALASSGILSKIVKSYSKNDKTVLLILRNLNLPGPNFVETAEDVAVFSSLVDLIRDSKWHHSLDQLLFASCVIYENHEAVRDSQGAKELVEMVMHLLPTVNDTDMVLLRNTVWMSSLLIRGTHTEAFSLPLLAHLMDKLSISDFDIYKDVLLAFGGAAKNVDNEEFILEEAIPTVVSLIPTVSCNLLPPLIHALVTFFEESRDFIDKCLECDLLDYIPFALRNNESCADACWLLGIVCDSPSRRKLVAENEFILFQIATILKNGTYDQRKECVDIVSHLCESPVPHSPLRPFLLTCIPSLCDLLTVMDALIVRAALDTLLAVLNEDDTLGVRDAATKIEECDGLSKLEFLQNSRTAEVSMLAIEIMDLHFNEHHDVENELDVQLTIMDVVKDVVVSLAGGEMLPS